MVLAATFPSTQSGGSQDYFSSGVSKAEKIGLRAAETLTAHYWQKHRWILMLSRMRGTTARWGIITGPRRQMAKLCYCGVIRKQIYLFHFLQNGPISTEADSCTGKGGLSETN